MADFTAYAQRESTQFRFHFVGQDNGITHRGMCNRGRLREQLSASRPNSDCLLYVDHV